MDTTFSSIPEYESSQDGSQLHSNPYRQRGAGQESQGKGSLHELGQGRLQLTRQPAHHGLQYTDTSAMETSVNSLLDTSTSSADYFRTPTKTKAPRTAATSTGTSVHKTPRSSRLNTSASSRVTPSRSRRINRTPGSARSRGIFQQPDQNSIM